MNAPMRHQTPLLDLDLLKTLVAIAETGNFSAAADVVFRTPSAISMQVKKMEDLLGRSIFNRDSRSVTLTDDGEMLLTHARRVLALNQQIVAQFIAPEVAGTVRLGALDHATEQFVPQVLQRFADTHPAVTVDVVIENSNVLADMIQKNELDLAIVSCSSKWAERQKAEILHKERLVWAGVKGGIAVEQTPLPVSVWEEGCVWRKSGLEALQKQGRDFRITFMSAYIAGQKAGILADLAIAPLPKSSCTDRIVALDDSYGLPELPEYGLSMIVGHDASPSVKAVADHLRATFANK